MQELNGVEMVTGNLPKNASSKHDVSESDTSSSEESEKDASKRSNAHTLKTSDSVVFTDSLSENESVNSSIGNIIAKLDSPKKNKSGVSSLAANSSLPLSGLKLNAMDDPSSVKSISHQNSSVSVTSIGNQPRSPTKDKRIQV